MMYSEFIEKTGYSETYMTYNDYTTYIEPVYMESNKDKDNFCKDFYKSYRNNVQKIVEMLISAKTVKECEDYIFNGNNDVMNDVRTIENTLKQAFLKTYAKREKGWFKRV